MEKYEIRYLSHKYPRPILDWLKTYPWKKNNFKSLKRKYRISLWTRYREGLLNTQKEKIKKSESDECGQGCKSRGDHTDTGGGSIVGIAGITLGNNWALSCKVSYIYLYMTQQFHS